MPKKLEFKLCPFCGTQIMGVKRADRKAYYYAPRCVDCAYKALTPEVLATKRRVIADVRVTCAVGEKRLHTASDGFVYVTVKIAQPNKWEYEHRVLTNAPKNSHVHHKNKNTLDNRLENLVVLTVKDHRHAHALTRWARFYDCCTICGTTDRRHLSHGRCTACYQRVRTAARTGA